MPKIMSSARRLHVLLPMMAGLIASAQAEWAHARPAPWPRSIAFYYGDAPAAAELERFELAVVEPDNGFLPAEAVPSPTRWLAYISVGEVGAYRHYYPDIPEAWKIGRNEPWKSEVLDQSVPEWPAFLVDRIATPLWALGYQGFFLDTLDSYELAAHTPEARRRQREGLIAAIGALRARFPKALIIVNRGFELLPAIHAQVDAVAFESLFKGWSEADRQYRDVPESDRDWLLARIRETKRYGLPMISIDYCPPADVGCARDTVRRIKSLGLIPYIGDGRLQHVNFAALE